MQGSCRGVFPAPHPQQPINMSIGPDTEGTNSAQPKVRKEAKSQGERGKGKEPLLLPTCS